MTTSVCPRPDKRAHRTREKAMTHMRYLRRQGANDLNVYQCCDHWHVGHSPAVLGQGFRRAVLRRGTR